MTPRRKKSKIERSMETLEQLPGEVGDAIAKGMGGELDIRHERGPDLHDYEATDDGYQRYLIDAHEWAQEELRDALATQRELLAAFGEDLEEYPELGMNRPSDREHVEEMDQQLEQLIEQLEVVDEWWQVLGEIEGGFKDL